MGEGSTTSDYFTLPSLHYEGKRVEGDRGRLKTKALLDEFMETKPEKKRKGWTEGKKQFKKG